MITTWTAHRFGFAQVCVLETRSGIVATRTVHQPDRTHLRVLERGRDESTCVHQVGLPSACISQTESVIYSLCCPNWFFPMENLGRFSQGKPAATDSRHPTLINFRVHAGSFRVSIIHRAVTWTTGPLTCVRDHSCACVYTLGVGHTVSESAQHFGLGKSLTNRPTH